MTKRLIFGAVGAAVILVGAASPALAAHCVNLSKHANNPDAGNRTTVLIDPVTEAPTFIFEGNGNGSGGFANVYLDVGSSPGELDAGDVLLEEDVMIGRNHDMSHPSPEPWVNPGSINKTENDNATDSRGMGFHHSD